MMFEHLSQLPCVRLRLRIPDGSLPCASALRGAIGRQLLATPGSPALPVLFPSESADAPSSRLGVACPWALQVDEASRVLEIGLFGSAVAHLPELMVCLLLACRGRVGETSGLRLGGVEHEQPVGSGAWRTGLPDASCPWSRPPPRPDQITIHFTSPLRLRRDGKDVRPDDFRPRDLMANLMRRYTALLQQAGLPQPDWHPREMLAAIAAANWQMPAFGWRKQGRYSQRQQAEMHLGGIVGSARLDTRDIGELWPLLWMGQFTHAGRTPSLGMGRYRIIQTSA